MLDVSWLAKAVYVSNYLTICRIFDNFDNFAHCITALLVPWEGDVIHVPLFSFSSLCLLTIHIFIEVQYS